MLDIERLYPLLEGEPETPAGGEGTPAEAAPDGQEKPEAPKPEEKTLTQSQVNALIAKEKAKAAKAAREEVEAERKKAEMTEADKLKADQAEAAKKLAEAEARALAAERRAALAGKVADPTAALKLLDEEKHLDGDGNVNVDALLKTYPFLAPAPQGPTPTSGAGGTTPKGMTAEKLKSMDSKEFAEIQKRVAAGERVTL
jgi:hypothetical protein